MTEEQYHSIKETYRLLCRITDPQKTPRLPAELRKQATKCLKHYPIKSDLRDIINTVDFFNPR